MERSTGRHAAPAAALGDVYARLLSIDLRHDYYDGPNGGRPGRFADLILEPTSETATRLAQYELLWRRRRDGFDILFGAGRMAELAESLAQGASGAPGRAAEDMLRTLLGGPLLLTLRLVEPRFLNVTDLPAGFGTGDAALCLSNRRNRAAAGGVAAIAVDSAHLLPLEAVAYDWMLAHSPELNEKDRAAAVAKRPLADAWCRRPEAAAAMAETVEAAQDPRAARLPLAYVEIFLTPPTGGPPAAPEGLFAVTASAAGAMAVTPVRYEIRFAARATRWLYVVADRSGNLVEGSLSVVDPAADRVAFRPSGQAPRIPGASGAYAFLSDVPVPLRQQPARRFVLKGKTRNAPRRVRSLIDPLPAPAAESLPRRGRDGAADVSEILVFV